MGLGIVKIIRNFRGAAERTRVILRLTNPPIGGGRGGQAGKTRYATGIFRLSVRAHCKYHIKSRALDPTLYMVPQRGLEPPRIAALVPETSVYTNFTTAA